MFGYQYRHDIIKRYITAFGSLFNGISIDRYDKEQNVWHTVKVPLSYGPREKLLESARKVFGDAKQAIATTGPRISMELGPIYYDTQRVTNKYTKIKFADYTHTYVPAPYNFEFSVYVAAKTNTDANRIIEQMLPFFQPHVTLQIKPLGDHTDHVKDITVWLQGTSCEDDYEGEAETRQLVVWTLSFVLKGFLYGPPRTGGIIKRVELNFNPTADGHKETIIIRPGMTAAGLPTTDPLLSIDSNLINEADNWDFITQYERS